MNQSRSVVLNYLKLLTLAVTTAACTALIVVVNAADTANSTTATASSTTSNSTNKLSKKSAYGNAGPTENSQLEPTTGVGWGGFYTYPARFAGYPITGKFPSLQPGYGGLDFQNYAFGYYSPYYTGYLNQGYGVSSGYKPLTGGYGGYDGYGGNYGGGGGGAYGARSSLTGRSQAKPSAAGNRFSNRYKFTENLQGRINLGAAAKPSPQTAESILGDSTNTAVRDKGDLVAEDGAPARAIEGSSYGISYGQEQEQQKPTWATGISALPSEMTHSRRPLLTGRQNLYGGYGGGGGGGPLVGGVAGREQGDSNAYSGLSANGYRGYPGQYGGAMGLGAYGGYPAAVGYGVGRYGNGYGGYGARSGLHAREGESPASATLGDVNTMSYGANGGPQNAALAARDGGDSRAAQVSTGSAPSYGAYGGSGWGGYGGGGYGGTETANPGYALRYPGYKANYSWGFGGPTKAYTTYSR